MSGFAQDLLKGFVQGITGNYGLLKDYRHAAKIFRTDNYALNPRTKYLFHVYFNVNTEIPALRNLFSNGAITSVSVLVKTAQLPSYTFDVDTLNQYNRKRLVQTKINYDPVNITFHDDTSDLIRTMWYNYYSYYYADPTQGYNNIPNQSGSSGMSATNSNGFGYNSNDIYNSARSVSDWGYIGETYYNSSENTVSTTGSKPPFFRDITIYGLANKQFAQYTLINPMITNWKHDTYDYSQGNGTVQHSMDIKYETVKYYSGAIGGQTPSTVVTGFASPENYDNESSDITRPGTTNTVYGQGGIVYTSGDIQDLQSMQSGFNGLQNVTGAVQTAGVNINTYQSQPSRISTSTQDSSQNIAQGSLPGAVQQIQNSGGGAFFPTPPLPVTGQYGETTNLNIDPNNPGGPGGAGAGG
jgi:hypothetical protein